MGAAYVVAELRLGLVEFNWTFVFQIMNTIILFLLLKKFLFKPVNWIYGKSWERNCRSIQRGWY